LHRLPAGVARPQTLAGGWHDRTGAAGSLLHSVLVVGMMGLLGLYPWALIGATFVANILPEMIVSTVLVTAVTAAWLGIAVGKRRVQPIKSILYQKIPSP
jgi:uncharacterized MnhB-related membrane protein